MSIRLFTLSIILFAWWGTGLTSAQEFERIDGLRLRYWHAFDGEMIQTLEKSNEGQLLLLTMIFPHDSALGEAGKAWEEETEMSSEDLLPLVQLFNSSQARRHFAETKIELNRLDGASLSLRVEQGSLAMQFLSQFPFDDEASEFDVEISEIAKRFFATTGSDRPLSLENRVDISTIPRISIEDSTCNDALEFIAYRAGVSLYQLTRIPDRKVKVEISSDDREEIEARLGTSVNYEGRDVTIRNALHACLGQAKLDYHFVFSDRLVIVIKAQDIEKKPAPSVSDER